MKNLEINTKKVIAALTITQSLCVFNLGMTAGIILNNRLKDKEKKDYSTSQTSTLPLYYYEKMEFDGNDWNPVGLEIHQSPPRDDEDTHYVFHGAEYKIYNK